jgi:hypothetical protein
VIHRTSNPFSNPSGIKRLNVRFQIDRRSQRRQSNRKTGGSRECEEIMSIVNSLLKPRGLLPFCVALALIGLPIPTGGNVWLDGLGTKAALADDADDDRYDDDDRYGGDDDDDYYDDDDDGEDD